MKAPSRSELLKLLQASEDTRWWSYYSTAKGVFFFLDEDTVNYFYPWEELEAAGLAPKAFKG